MKKNLKLVVKPQKVGRKGQLSHHLNDNDEMDLKKYRNQIELLNGNIRRFRRTDDQVGHYNYNLSIVPICFSVMYNMLSDLHDPLNRYLIRNKKGLFLIKHLSIK